MPPSLFRYALARCFAVTLAAALASMPAAADTAQASGDATHAPDFQYTPVVGQPGKDVIWVPTADTLVEHMLDMAAITPADFLVDLGSGDGRTVIAAARRGTRAHGIEYNPDMVALSRKNAHEAGVSELATFEQGDIFESDFSNATVVTLFLLPELNLRLRPTLLEMAPGTRIVSNSFLMGDWQPDDSVEAGPSCSEFCNAYSWIVPARVAGTWQLQTPALEAPATMQLSQQYQQIEGHLHGNDGAQQALTNPQLQGAAIRFEIDGAQYVGTVDGNRMQGTIVGQANAPWQATRQTAQP